MSVADVPAQTEFELALMESAGAALTVIVVWEVAVQPFEAVPVTVYVCVAFGVKAIPFVMPLFQE